MTLQTSQWFCRFSKDIFNNVSRNCHFLNQLPTPVLCVIVKWSLSNDVTIVANSPITSLPTSNIEVHADEKLEIQGKKIMFQYLVTCAVVWKGS